MKEAAIQRRKQAMEEAKRQQQTALAVQSQNEIQINELEKKKESNKENKQ